MISKQNLAKSTASFGKTNLKYTAARELFGCGNRHLPVWQQEELHKVTTIARNAMKTGNEVMQHLML